MRISKARREISALGKADVRDKIGNPLPSGAIAR